MTLRVSDVHEIARQLVAAGREVSADTNAILHRARDWYQASNPNRRVLDEQTFAYLCECVRSEPAVDIRDLAVGTLLFVQRDLESHPERVRFVTNFALRRIASLGEHVFSWRPKPMQESEAAEALELFELVHQEPSIPDDELVSETLAFVRRFETSTDFLGRFSQDLKALVSLLEDASIGEEKRALARGALVYFVEKSDAIPDDLGPVGLIDDAMVANHVLEQIHPGRAVIGDFLDDTVRQWPFLLDLAMDEGGSRYKPSGFLIVNCAFLLSDTERDTKVPGSVVIVPEAGPLSFVTGFVLALAYIRDQLMAGVEARFEQGERLIARNDNTEAFFQAYGRWSGTDFVPCEPADATHFQLRVPQRKVKKKRSGLRDPDSGGGEVINAQPIASIASWTRSARDTKTLARGILSHDHQEVALGPLDRLFGLTSPGALPAEYGQVIVISPIRTCAALAHGLTLYGTPLADVIPIGRSRVEDTIVERRWTSNDGPAGRPLLNIVRTSADALEIVEAANSPVDAVVASVRFDSVDAANLIQIAQEGVRVLAFVEERDVASSETFESGPFNFWQWDSEWLSHLHWPTTCSDRIGRYERTFRRRVVARSKEIVVQFPELERAHEALRAIEANGRHGDDDSVIDAAGGGYVALLSLCREFTRSNSLVETDLKRFRERVRVGMSWWGDEIAGHANVAETALQQAVESIQANNPKLAELLAWARENPSGVVITRSRVADQLSNLPEVAGLRWATGADSTMIEAPVLVPTWLGRGTMERILIPPISEHLTLLLYEPERMWFSQLVNRARRSRIRLSRLASERSPMPRLPRSKPATEVPTDVPVEPDSSLEDVVERYRRRSVIRTLEAGAAEEAEARLVHFVGGYWAAFTPNYSLNTVTHLVDDTDLSEEETQLRQVRLPDLRVGDRILMVQGSDREALAHAADKQLGRGTRQTSGIWRHALRRSLEAGHNEHELQERLAENGCKRTIQTIRNWLFDEQMIGPQDEEATLAAIVRATQDEELTKQLDTCIQSIRRVRSAHHSVGHELAKRVLERVREWLDIEASADALLEIEERVVLLTVDEIDHEPVNVPRWALNSLREEP